MSQAWLTFCVDRVSLPTSSLKCTKTNNESRKEAHGDRKPKVFKKRTENTIPKREIAGHMDSGAHEESNLL